jgi:hypothetical protein
MVVMWPQRCRLLSLGNATLADNLAVHVAVRFACVRVPFYAAVNWSPDALML